MIATTTRLLQQHQFIAAILALLIAVVIAATWLVFPYAVKDRNLIEQVGSNVRQEKLNNAISIGTAFTVSDTSSMAIKSLRCS